MMKNICRVAVLIFSIMLGSVTGCSAVMEQKEVEVLIPEYTMDTLPNGMFLKVKDTFYTPYNQNKTFSSLPENISEKRILWYTDNKIHIPTYQNGNQVIFKSASNIPAQFVLEGFEHVCDSLGIIGIRLNDNGRYILSGDSVLQPTSDAFLKLSEYLKKGNLVLDSINGNTIQNRMINKTGSISGLTKDAAYTLGFYIGTQYYETEILADTEIYVSKSINTITRYDMTKNGYLVLQMPELMTPGLYDINGMGVVNYSGVLQEP